MKKLHLSVYILLVIVLIFSSCGQEAYEPISKNDMSSTCTLFSMHSYDQLKACFKKNPPKNCTIIQEEKDLLRGNFSKFVDYIVENNGVKIPLVNGEYIPFNDDNDGKIIVIDRDVYNQPYIWYNRLYLDQCEFRIMVTYPNAYCDTLSDDMQIDTIMKSVFPEIDALKGTVEYKELQLSDRTVTAMIRKDNEDILIHFIYDNMLVLVDQYSGEDILNADGFWKALSFE